jgi:phospholipid/cholesterol/gamma-HCH transport system substrate-binding protein
MFKVSSEAKVGLFVLIAMIILAYMSVQVGKQTFTLRKGYRVEVIFSNVAGLDPDSSVQIAGVEVGRVESIKLKDGMALVTMRIKPEVKLEKDVTAAIKTHGVLGDKYIEIIPGTKGESFLAEGEQITKVEKAADLDRLLQQLAFIADDIKSVTGSLKQVMGGEAGVAALGDILENTRQLTANLNKVIKQNDEKIAQTMDNLKGASREMEKTFASLSDITESIKKGEGTMGQLIKDKGMAEKLNKTITSLEGITDKINQGKGTIGKLVNDEETVKTLNESLAGINRYVTKAEQFRTFLSYRGEYLFDKSDAKSHLELKIQPKEDKFYILGLTHDPRGKRTVREFTVDGKTTKTEEWERDDLLFTAQIGKRFKDLIVRGGIIESTGGLGLDYLTFNDKLKLTFEAFDFSSDQRTHLKAYAEYQLFKHLYLSAGWDDFISDRGNSSPFVGFSIRFEDEDLKYLLTSTPIPK